MADISLFEAIRNTTLNPSFFPLHPCPKRSLPRFWKQPSGHLVAETPSLGTFWLSEIKKLRNDWVDWYLRAWSAIVGDMSQEQAASESYRSGGDMGHQMENVPVVILVCVRLDGPRCIDSVG